MRLSTGRDRDEDQAIAVVHAALDAGVRLFDVAPHYGQGLAEQRLGAALAAAGPERRAAPLVSTKVGRRLAEGEDPASLFVGAPALHSVFDFSEAGVRDSLHASLERLGLDHVDVALVHDPDDHAEQAITQSFPALRALREEGLVRWIGSGMNRAPLLERFVTEVGCDAVLLAGRWTLLDHGPEARRLLDRCEADGVAVLLGGVLNSGLLAGGSTYDYGPPPAEVLARRDAAAAVCAEHGVPLLAAALQVPFGHPAVSTLVVGLRSPAEVAEADALLRLELPAGLWDDLRRAGVLPDDLPTPA